MKHVLPVCFISFIVILTSCDLRSGIAKQEMDEFNGTPTPTITPFPTASPIDPMYVVEVDTSLDGELLSVDGDKPGNPAACTKYNTVLLNTSLASAALTGPCRKVVVNGDGNTITTDAAAEFVFNGSGNHVFYSRFVNGKDPIVTENLPNNLVEHLPAEELKKLSRKQAK